MSDLRPQPSPVDDLHGDAWKVLSESSSPTICIRDQVKVLIELSRQQTLWLINITESVSIAEDWNCHLPFKPVLSGSTWTSSIFPSLTTSAYLLLRSPPKMELPSKDRSSAFVKATVGSARKRIYKMLTFVLDIERLGICFERCFGILFWGFMG